MKATVRTNAELLVSALRKISFQIADAEISKKMKSENEQRSAASVQDRNEAEYDRQS